MISNHVISKPTLLCVVIFSSNFFYYFFYLLFFLCSSASLLAQVCPCDFLSHRLSLVVICHFCAFFIRTKQIVFVSFTCPLFTWFLSHNLHSTLFSFQWKKYQLLILYLFLTNFPFSCFFSISTYSPFCISLFTPLASPSCPPQSPPPTDGHFIHLSSLPPSSPCSPSPPPLPLSVLSSQSLYPSDTRKCPSHSPTWHSAQRLKG